MKKNLLFIFFLWCCQVLTAQYQGHWNGILLVNQFKLPIVFHVDFNDGVCEAVFDSPAQNVYNIAVTKTVCENDSIYFFMDNIGAHFAGAVANEKITGEFTQGGQTFNLILNQGQYKEDKPERPQEPHPPFAYVIREMKVYNKKDSVTLCGTLTLPDSVGKFPLVILISGSGPQNRNEEIMGHKPFWVIADYLTRKGYAVFRYDDRGTGMSTGNFARATSVDFSYDAESCFDYFAGHPNILSKKIGLAGHSEGGLIAPMIAGRNKKVAFIILLAGPGVEGKEIIIKQTELISTAEGETDAKQMSESNRRMIDALIAHKKPTEAAAAMRNILREELNKLSPQELSVIPDTAAYIEANINSMNTHWFRFFVTHNPADDLQKVKCPVLALNGDKDLQVDADQNLPAIETALKKGRNRNYRIEKMSGLNHLFQHTQTGKISEYASLTETIAPEVLECMVRWMDEQLK